MSEQDLTRAIVETLQAKNIWCWRTNSGAVVTGHGASRRFVQMAPAGTPDILGVLSNGSLFGLEAKTARGRQSASQVAWQKRAEDNGVRYRVVRSISEALDAVSIWTNK